MQLRIQTFDLKLRHTFTISRGSLNVQPTFIVELEQDGLRGYGEATTNRYYGVTLESLAAAVESVRPLLESHRLTDPEPLWDEICSRLPHDRFALCALDCATHDLWGKLRGAPVWKLWGLTHEHLPPSNYTIAIDTPEVMRAKLAEFPDWPSYKIKLGTPHDLELVRSLRAETSAPFRVDANCGWTADETLYNAAELIELGVELIEQPLPADRWDDMRRIKPLSPLPLIADESCRTEADIDRCAECFHGVNIKLVKCGGLTPARWMISQARQLGLAVMIGCMTESSVGISAAAQLLPLVDYADLDGAVLLAKDIATGVRVEQGRVIFPDTNGCGVEPSVSWPISID